jgi:heptaprenyl diphosphate synthase
MIPSTAQLGSRIMNQKTVALLGAFCLFLSTIEYMIPKPMPFMRLGIANLPLLLALDMFTFKAYLLLLMIKIIGQALVTGTLFSYIFLFSLAGSAASALIMFGMRKSLGQKRISFIGVSVAGAVISNLVQIFLARLFVFGSSVKYIVPPFLAAGIITGIALGVFCEYFTQQSRWYKAHIDGDFRPERTSS